MTWGSDLAEVMWQESDTKIWNTLAHELESVTECLYAEEEGEEDVNMRDDDRRVESDGEEQAPMEDDEQRDGSKAEQEVHSKQGLEWVKKALTKLLTNLGHPGVKEMVRVLQPVELRSWQSQKDDECIVMSVLKTCNRNSPDQQFLVKCWTSTNVLAWTF